jgi:hypothetical protein
VVRKLVMAWMAVLVFGFAAVAQATPPDYFSDPEPIDISEYFTDPFWAEVCNGDVATLPEDMQLMLCPPPPSPPSPSQPVTAPAPRAAPAPVPRMLSPFPIVRLVGSVTQVGTRIHLLQVRAPKGSQALVRCRGRKCPVKRVKKLVRGRPLRVAAVERVMPAGVVLEVLVRGGESIGKFTRFRFRPNRRPLRRDGCVWPGTTRMARCPGA